MAKITLDSILSGFNLSKINSNFQKIQDELNNKVLYRDPPVGEPNTVQKDIDYNNKSLLNVNSLIINSNLTVGGQTVQQLINTATNNVVTTTATNAATASTAASNASASASSASSYAAQALSYKDTAYTYLDSFKKQYQGRSDTNPTTRYDGTALQIGDLYFNTTVNAMQVYSNTGWISAGSSVNGTSRRQTFTYSSGTPTFTVTGGYDSGYVDVYLNGYKLVRTSDFDDTSGSSITIQGTLTAGDIVDVVAYGSFNIANVYTKSESDAYRTAIYSRIGDALSLGGRNRIINGDMRIDQRNNGSASTASQITWYTVDRMLLTSSQTSKLSAQRISAAGVIPFEYFHRVTTATPATIVSADFFAFEHRIEAQGTTDFLYGTSSAISSVLSFWVRASASGDYSVAVRNNAAGNTRAYTTKITVNSANTWEYKTIVIPGDTGGNQFTGNSTGLRVWFDLGSGSNFNAVQTNTWQSSDLFKYPGTVNMAGVSGAFLDITGLQLEPGTVATPFERVPYSEQLLRCKRYFQNIPVQGIASSATVLHPTKHQEVEMRIVPTFTFSGAIRRTNDGQTRTPTSPSIGASASALFYIAATSWSTPLAAGEVYDAVNGANLAASAEL